MNIPVNVTFAKLCWHDRVIKSVGPTTDQINRYCPDCGATNTTYPDRSAVTLASERDGARYRHLRAHAYIELKCDSPRVDGWRPEHFDALVDAAIDEEQGK